jgi:thioredoxin reductase
MHSPQPNRKDSSMNTLDSLPVVVIGAGPVGLSAASHLYTRGMAFQVLEAGAGVAECFRATAHVRLFSPWKMNVDPVAAQLLERRAWQPPDPTLMPTAGELRALYLEPLARALAPHVCFNTRVQAISRRGFDKVKTTGREHAPFVLRVARDGEPLEIEARAVIDATGTWGNPNPMGATGLSALGEKQLAHHIFYGMPDVLGQARARYAGKRVLVVGSGHSAAGSLIALARLAEEGESTRLAWVIRSDNLERIFGGGTKDGLPERGSLGTKLRELMQSGVLELFRAFQIEGLHEHEGRLRVVGVGRGGSRQHISGIDEVVVATGARPNLELARELRVALDPWLESTPQLAPLIDPNVHSCGSVPPHGHRELSHPEVGYYTIGAKSYGRAPNFLLATGYEQARSVVAALAGDFAAADDVQLELPETGVCSSDTTFCPSPSNTKTGCCG